MKKVMILLAIVLTANVMMAQKKDRTDAYMYNKNKQYDRAVTAIEKCVNHEQFLGMKPAEQAKAWHYRGEIYYNVYMSPEFRETVPNALELAVESYGNCVATDEGYYNDNKQDIFSHISEISRQFGQAGVDAWNNKDFATASDKFYSAYQVMAGIGAVDIDDLSNAAQAALNGKQYDKAIEYLNELQSKGQDDVNIYKNLAAAYNGAGNTDKAFEMITTGLEKFPGDASMIIEKVNIYLKQGKGAEAVNDLLELNTLDPNNASILFILGTIYGDENNEGVYDTDKAIGYYKQALAANPNYSDAAYNLGGLYITMSNKVKAEANEITGVSKAELERYDSLIEQAQELLREGLPYVQQAYETQHDDAIKQVLKTIYIQLNMTEEAKALDAQ